MLSTCQAAVYAHFTDSGYRVRYPKHRLADHKLGFDCNQADSGQEYNVKNLSCLSDEAESKWIKISKITKAERRLCLKKFASTGCSDSSSDEMEAQQLDVRKSSPYDGG